MENYNKEDLKARVLDTLNRALELINFKKFRLLKRAAVTAIFMLLFPIAFFSYYEQTHKQASPLLAVILFLILFAYLVARYNKKSFQLMQMQGLTQDKNDYLISGITFMIATTLFYSFYCFLAAESDSVAIYTLSIVKTLNRYSYATSSFKVNSFFFTLLLSVASVFASKYAQKLKR